MREVGQLTRKCLDQLQNYIAPGLSTAWIDRFVEEFADEHRVVSACYGYKGFPNYCCTSVNHVICHGIPSPKKILKEGDIVKVDVTLIKDGWYGDSCRTYIVGQKINAKVQKLVEVTEAARQIGIEVAQPGNLIGDIGRAIQIYVEGEGFSVVRDFVAHGIGREFHQPPAIPHYYTTTMPDVWTRIIPGMMFTIEPMVNIGKPNYKIMPDGWTVVTKDKSWSAQWEHTIGITENGNEIFT